MILPSLLSLLVAAASAVTSTPAPGEYTLVVTVKAQDMTWVKEMAVKSSDAPVYDSYIGEPGQLHLKIYLQAVPSLVDGRLQLDYTTQVEVRGRRLKIVDAVGVSTSAAVQVARCAGFVVGVALKGPSAAAPIENARIQADVQTDEGKDTCMITAGAARRLQVAATVEIAERRRELKWDTFPSSVDSKGHATMSYFLEVTGSGTQRMSEFKELFPFEPGSRRLALEAGDTKIFLKRYK